MGCVDNTDHREASRSIAETLLSENMSVIIREARSEDAAQITSIFHACYDDEYAYRQFYDTELVRGLIYSEDTLILVAEDTETHELLGTASVIYNKGANSDLTGEFGRLAVIPEARNRGVGKLLMAERLSRVASRLHVALVYARLVHPYSLRIAEAQDFAVIGFLPMKSLIVRRESVALLARYTSDALKLRKNNPRVVPEIYPLAAQSLTNCGLEVDVIVDETSLAYSPSHEHFDITEMQTDGYSSLLRIERGRVRNREI
ncbi:MAG: GNAT family N-acetyltransferase, partial [Cyanobacteria bacterium]|nr:GNAT family N-acetyltransferase [Cyanobacteriota bacterium]